MDQWEDQICTGPSKEACKYCSNPCVAQHEEEEQHQCNGHCAYCEDFNYYGFCPY